MSVYLVQRVVHQLLLDKQIRSRSEEHTSELQSRGQLVCRLLLEKKNIGRIGSVTAIVVAVEDVAVAGHQNHPVVDLARREDLREVVVDALLNVDDFPGHAGRVAD